MSKRFIPTWRAKLDHFISDQKERTLIKASFFIGKIERLGNSEALQNTHHLKHLHEVDDEENDVRNEIHQDDGLNLLAVHGRDQFHVRAEDEFLEREGQEIRSC